MITLKPENFNLFPHENTVGNKDSDMIQKFGIQNTFKTATKDSKYVNLSQAMLGVLKPATIGVIYGIFSNSVTFRTVKETLKKMFKRSEIDNAFDDMREHGFSFKVICRDGSKKEDLFFVADKPFTQEEITFVLANLKLPIYKIDILESPLTLKEIKKLQEKSFKEKGTYAFANLDTYNDFLMPDFDNTVSTVEKEQLTTKNKTTKNKTTNNINNKDLFISLSETSLNQNISLGVTASAEEENKSFNQSATAVKDSKIEPKAKERTQEQPKVTSKAEQPKQPDNQYYVPKESYMNPEYIADKNEKYVPVFEKPKKPKKHNRRTTETKEEIAAAKQRLREDFVYTGKITSEFFYVVLKDIDDKIAKGKVVYYYYGYAFGALSNTERQQKFNREKKQKQLEELESARKAFERNQLGAVTATQDYDRIQKLVHMDWTKLK